MSDIYLCKIKKAGEEGYGILIDEKPEKKYKWLAKKVKEYDPKASVIELLEYKKKEYSIVAVYVNVSSKIRKIRSLIENNNYKYKIYG